MSQISACVFVKACPQSLNVVFHSTFNLLQSRCFCVTLSGNVSTVKLYSMLDIVFRPLPTKLFFCCCCCYLLSTQKESQIFPPTTGGAEKMAADMEIPFLGKVPLDPKIGRCCDEGKSFLSEVPESPAADAYKQIIQSTFLILVDNL